MTLTTGTLYLASGGLATTVIRNEILGSNGAYDLSDAIAAKNNGATADSMRDFAGYAHATAPSAPVKHSITEGPIGNVSGSYIDTASNETCFIIQYRINSGTWNTSFCCAANTTSYNISPSSYGGSNGDCWTMRVAACNGAGISSYATSNMINTLSNQK